MPPPLPGPQDVFDGSAVPLKNATLPNHYEKKSESLRPSWAAAWRCSFQEGIAHFYIASTHSPSAAEREELKLQMGELLSPVPIELHFRLIKKALVPKAKEPSIPTSFLFKEAKASLPSGVYLLRPLHYRINLDHGHLDFIILKLYIPEAKREDVANWQIQFENKHKVQVFIEHTQVYQDISRQLLKISDKEHLIRKDQIPRIRRIIGSFHGEEPKLNGAYASLSSAKATDLRSHHFITLDPAGAKDMEDALSAERLADGRIKLSVAFVDISSFVQAGSYADHYCQRMGASIYGRTRVIPALGAELAFGPACLKAEEERLAWIVEMLVDDLGSRPVLFKAPYRGRIIVKENMANENFVKLAANREDLSILAEASTYLRFWRNSRTSLFRVEELSPAEEVVAECMIAAKHTLANYCIGQTPSFIYKVHAPPSSKTKHRIANEAQKLGLQISPDDFGDPLKFTKILHDIQTLSKGSDERAAEARSLSDLVLATFLTHSRYDVYNAGHHALALDAYMEIKPRDAAGASNQLQLAAMIYGSSELSEADMKIRARDRNRRRRVYHWAALRLSVLEDLEHTLAQVGQSFEARVEAKTKKGYLVTVPRFSRYGFLKTQEPLAISQMLTASLLGFNAKLMRYQFAVTD